MRRTYRDLGTVLLVVVLQVPLFGLAGFLYDAWPAPAPEVQVQQPQIQIDPTLMRELLTPRDEHMDSPMPDSWPFYRRLAQVRESH